MDEFIRGCDEFFQDEQKVWFCGHTHVPVIIDCYGMRYSVDSGMGVNVSGKRKFFINVGSVGQPRKNGENRASYAILDNDMVEMKYVAYDRAATMKKIIKTPELDNQYAKRLD